MGRLAGGQIAPRIQCVGKLLYLVRVTAVPALPLPGNVVPREASGCDLRCHGPFSAVIISISVCRRLSTSCTRPRRITPLSSTSSFRSLYPSGVPRYHSVGTVSARPSMSCSSQLFRSGCRTSLPLSDGHSHRLHVMFQLSVSFACATLHSTLPSNVIDFLFQGKNFSFIQAGVVIVLIRYVFFWLFHLRSPSSP